MWIGVREGDVPEGGRHKGGDIKGQHRKVGMRVRAQGQGHKGDCTGVRG